MLDTIKSNDEISRIFSKGKRYSSRYVTFIVMRKTVGKPNENGQQHDLNGRVAFIAGKKHGNAVWRNSAKRRMREIYRANADILGNYDILFIARPYILESSYSKVLNACEQTLKKI